MISVTIRIKIENPNRTVQNTKQ